MKIYYTGADSFNAVQKDKDKSLGGYLSQTQVPNDLIGNLFGDVSMYTIDKSLRETRALIVHNDSGGALVNFSIHFDKLTGSLGLFEVAAVLLTLDGNGELYMEKIDNIRATPYVGDFVEADTVANKQLISASLADGAYVGLWLRRSIDSKTDATQFNCDTLWAAHLAEEEQVIKGQVDTTLSWD